MKEPEAVTLTHPLDSTKSGVSAYQFIAESHIAVHTWPEVKGARVTIDSCKDFDASEAVDLIRKMLKPQKVDIRQALWVNTVHVEEKSAKVGIVEKGLAILKSLIG